MNGCLDGQIDALMNYGWVCGWTEGWQDVINSSKVQKAFDYA